MGPNGETPSWTLSHEPRDGGLGGSEGFHGTAVDLMEELRWLREPSAFGKRETRDEDSLGVYDTSDPPVVVLAASNFASNLTSCEYSLRGESGSPFFLFACFDFFLWRVTRK
jgi:hypothetical protein